MEYHEPPVQEINHQAFDVAGISVSILREDLNHPYVSGNKWWKLRDNIQEAKISGKPVLTFGGAFSNHLYATAAACNEARIPCVAVVRGEEGPHESATLSFLKRMGAKLIHVSRELYQKKESENFYDEIGLDSKNYFVIPEGGTNMNAIHSCAQWGNKIQTIYSNNFDSLLVPVGTGGTVAGLLVGLNGALHLHAFSALKSGGFLKDRVNHLASEYCRLILSTEKNFSNEWTLYTDFHFGGYGKRNEEVISFIKEMRPAIPLDAVYTAKMILGVVTLAQSGFFARGSKLLALHTGGLQGNAGFLI